jgi:hypothetical protein
LISSCRKIWIISSLLNSQLKIQPKQNQKRFFVYAQIWTLAQWAEFLLEMDLKILLRKTGARLNFKIALISLHIDPDLENTENLICPTFFHRSLQIHSCFFYQVEIFSFLKTKNNFFTFTSTTLTTFLHTKTCVNVQMCITNF